MDEEEAFQRERQAVALQALAQAIETIRQEKREPDYWERQHLCAGFVEMRMWNYESAANEAKLAMTIQAGRSKEINQSGYEDYDLMLLERLLREVQGEPFHLHPRF